MEYEWETAGEEFWMSDCAWWLGIDLIHHRREEIGKINLICRPKQVLYNLPDTKIECTIYKYSSESNGIDELYAAVGRFKSYWVVFNDKSSANKTVKAINSGNRNN